MDNFGVKKRLGGNTALIFSDDEIATDYPYCRLPAHYFDRLLAKVRSDRYGMTVHLERVARQNSERASEEEHRTRFGLN